MKKELYAFDFDDTLIVPVKQNPGWIPRKSPVNVTAISSTLQFINQAIASAGPESVVILTARSIPGAVRILGLEDIEVIAVGSHDPEAKAKWIDKQVKVRNLSKVTFIDDKRSHLMHVAALRCKYPNVEFQIYAPPQCE